MKKKSFEGDAHIDGECRTLQNVDGESPAIPNVDRRQTFQNDGRAITKIGQ